MFAISIALVLSMLVARGSITAKVDEIKSNAGTAVTIRPAGVMGFQGGGDPLTTEQITKITNTAHVSSVSLSLSDQLGTDDTDLESSIELGSFGQRQMRFENSDSSSTPPITEGADMPAPTPRITVTGTTDIHSVSTDGSDLNITAGSAIDGDSEELVALVGSDLAEKNGLEVGDTFTAYGSTITVKGIFDTGNTFQDSGVIIPLKTLQTLTDQADAVTTVVATIDSSDNVTSTVESLTSSLGDDADITSEIEQANASVESLQSISNLALGGVIGAAIAGGVIILLAMVMVVRERRREIGVIKAIGGTNRKVITQFTIEGLTLTVIGAILGLALGILVSGPMTASLVSSSQDSPTTIQGEPGATGGPSGLLRGGFDQIGRNIGEVSASLTPQIFVSAIGITLLIAVLGSAIPAWLTARIRPAEVLRTE